MKRLLSCIVSTLMLVSCLTLSGVAVSSESPLPHTAPKIQLQVTSDDVIGQVPFKVETASVESLGENEYVADYKIFVPFPGSEIKPFDSTSQEQDNNGLTTKIKITYYFKPAVGEIKITAVSGSWYGSLTGVELKNREVGVTDGVGVLGVGSESYRWYPTSDTFSYETGWDYVTYMPHDTTLMTGPRAYAEVDYRIPGMGGWDWHNFLLSIDIEPNAQ